jgi:hypothetical protein
MLREIRWDGRGREQDATYTLLPDVIRIERYEEGDHEISSFISGT